MAKLTYERCWRVLEAAPPPRAAASVGEGRRGETEEEAEAKGGGGHAAGREGARGETPSGLWRRPRHGPPNTGDFSSASSRPLPGPSSLPGPPFPAHSGRFAPDSFWLSTQVTLPLDAFSEPGHPSAAGRKPSPGVAGHRLQHNPTQARPQTAPWGGGGTCASRAVPVPGFTPGPTEDTRFAGWEGAGGEREPHLLRATGMSPICCVTSFLHPTQHPLCH